jgi:5-methylcytosine-specific restriction enzyme A
MTRKPRLRALQSRIATLDTAIARTPAKQADRVYDSPEWRRLRMEIITERGERCEDPEHRPDMPRGGVRIELDHIRELKDGGALLDRKNLLLRCRSCHVRKTHAERAKRFAL